MRSHVEADQHREALDDVVRLTALALAEISTRPLSTSDVAWAKGCFEKAATRLGDICNSVSEAKAAQRA